MNEFGVWYLIGIVSAGYSCGNYYTNIGKKVVTNIQTIFICQLNSTNPVFTTE